MTLIKDINFCAYRESSEEKNVQLSEVVTSTRELLLYSDTKDVIYNLLNNQSTESNNSVYVTIFSNFYNCHV